MHSSLSNGMVGHLFDWQIDRTIKTYRIVVVEPPFLEPTTHTAIFNAAISALLSPDVALVSTRALNVPTIEPFDLVTFPEAFLPAAELITTIEQLANLDKFGCIHVGLRPGVTGGHLFDLVALNNLVSELRNISKVDSTDLAKFSSWLGKQQTSKRFNIACLFTVDTDAKIRICLHPKMVRSKYEASPLAEDDMSQGDVLSLITLFPSNPNLLSITLQPLICADALQLDSDRPGHRPIDAVNHIGSSFDRRIPDYVDVVSVATCTPQPETQGQTSIKTRAWHQHFRKAFIRAADDPSFQRHAHAAFVLSNFWSIGSQERAKSNDNDIGGLSGLFLPVKVSQMKLPDFVQFSTYGMSDGETENSWSLPSKEIDTKRRVRACIAQLSPYGVSLPKARMLSFTINRLPRHAPPWGATMGLRNVTRHSTDLPIGALGCNFVESTDDDSQ
jgi:hypothetical protein